MTTPRAFSLHNRGSAIHLSSILAAAGALFALVFLNWHGEQWESQPYSWCGFDSTPAKVNTVCEHGWPVTFLRREGDTASAWRLNDHIANFDGTSLAIDLGVALVILLIGVGILECRVRLREGVASLSTREMLFLVSAVAACCGRWRYETSRWEAEQQAITHLPKRSWNTSFPEFRPAWLTRIVGRERLSIFDRVTWISWPIDTDNRKLLELAAQVREFGSIEGMTFDSPAISDEGVSAILSAASPESIDIPGTQVTGTAFRAIREARLRTLFASGSEFNDDGMKAIRNQVNLESLNLASTRVTDEGITFLTGMHRLRSLDLRETQITDAALETLRGLASLEFLGLPETLSPQAIATISAALPGAQVHTALDPPAALSMPVYPAQSSSAGGYSAVGTY